MDSGYGMYSELKQKREEALPLGKSTNHETQTIFSGWVVHFEEIENDKVKSRNSIQISALSKISDSNAEKSENKN